MSSPEFGVVVDSIDHLLDDHPMARVRESSQYSGLCRNGGDQCRGFMFGGELLKWSIHHADNV
jgi:hypothetical protein